LGGGRSGAVGERERACVRAGYAGLAGFAGKRFLASFAASRMLADPVQGQGPRNTRRTRKGRRGSM